MSRDTSSQPLPSRLTANDWRCPVRSLLVRPILVTLQHSPTLRGIDSAYVCRSYVRCRLHVTSAAAFTSRSLPPSRHVRCLRHVCSFVRLIRVTIPRSPSLRVIEMYVGSTSRYGASSCDANHSFSFDNTHDYFAG